MDNYDIYLKHNIALFNKENNEKINSILSKLTAIDYQVKYNIKNIQKGIVIYFKESYIMRYIKDEELIELYHEAGFGKNLVGYDILSGKFIVKDSLKVKNIDKFKSEYLKRVDVNSIRVKVKKNKQYLFNCLVKEIEDLFKQYLSKRLDILDEIKLIYNSKYELNIYQYECEEEEDFSLNSDDFKELIKNLFQTESKREYYCDSVKKCLIEFYSSELYNIYNIDNNLRVEIFYGKNNKKDKRKFDKLTIEYYNFKDNIPRLKYKNLNYIYLASGLVNCSNINGYSMEIIKNACMSLVVFDSMIEEIER